MNEATATQLRDTTANPAPLGLLGFGMTTVMLNLHNAGFFELNGMILAMGLCYGGTAQVIAGIMEWKKGNTFATTVVPATETAMAAYLAIWGLFTAVMFLGTFRLNRALQVVFGTLTILFFLLAFGDYTAASAGFKHATGYEGIVCGLAAIYTGLAQVLNELAGRTVLPLGMVKK
jgi:succinate-acetate transporter protein